MSPRAAVADHQERENIVVSAAVFNDQAGLVNAALDNLGMLPPHPLLHLTNFGLDGGLGD